MRTKNRQPDELRPVEIIPNFNLYAEGSCLIKCGNTHVICTATVDEKVPAWLKNEERGWITAEYSLLPRATSTRVSRETHGVGRSLRSVVDLTVLKGFSILIDCDVIQADGGTRTASITGSFIALYIALSKMVKEGKIPYNPIREFVAAISVGICHNEFLLDLEYIEDSSAQVDANFVLTESGKIVEIQGTAEGEPFSQEDYSRLMSLAQKGISQLIQLQKEVLKNVEI